MTITKNDIIPTMLHRGDITVEQAINMTLPELPICSVSGGKDSTALYCLMIEYFGENFLPVFADTGHEHPVTVNYVRNLHIMAGGPPVIIVKADFTKHIERKRLRLLRGRDAKTVADVRKNYQLSLNMKPTGNAFLDMMLWKGRAPSTKAQFCTEHLKLWPIKFYLDRNFPGREYVMFTGIRAGESRNRAKKQPFSLNTFYDCQQVFPLLYESAEDIFTYLESKGVPPNPLYALGFHRVGCFPCIHSRKDELAALPDWAWDRLEWYERTLSSTWFPPGIIPGNPGLTRISEVRNWCLTSRGGKQFDLFRGGAEDAPSCMTEWNICE